MFNDRLKVMNQSNSKQLILSAQEARNIHADLFDLLNYCATLNRKLSQQPTDTNINVQMDGGGF